MREEVQQPMDDEAKDLLRDVVAQLRHVGDCLTVLQGDAAVATSRNLSDIGTAVSTAGDTIAEAIGSVGARLVEAIDFHAYVTADEVHDATVARRYSNRYGELPPRT